MSRVKHIYKYVHYESRRSHKDWDNVVIVTACGVSATPTPKVTKRKKKVTCKWCKKSWEFKQKTIWEKLWSKLR